MIFIQQVEEELLLIPKQTMKLYNKSSKQTVTKKYIGDCLFVYFFVFSSKRGRKKFDL